MSAFNPNEIAKIIQGEGNFLHSAGKFYRYENGAYRPISDVEIKAIIKQELGDKSKIRLIDEVLEALRLDTNKESNNINRFGLNVINGMIDVEKMRLNAHDYRFYSTIQFKVEFKPETKCPLFVKTVAEWLDSSEKVSLLQEFLGYCLTNETSQEKILFLVGSGANGKSTLLHVMGSIFGTENCSAIPLDKLSNRFYQAELVGKSINLTSETPSKSVLCDDAIKSIVSGDLILGERKFQPPFSFKPKVKFIVACNEIPRTEDKSDALNRRLLILRFDRTYRDEEQDKTLKEKILQERSGIFNWMLEGLRNLHIRGYFNEPQGSVSEREAYRRENNTLILFVEEKCEICEQGVSRKGEFYDHYKKWCQESGLLPLSKPRLGKALKEHYKLGEDEMGGAADRYRVWTGIVLRGVL